MDPRAFEKQNVLFAVISPVWSLCLLTIIAVYATTESTPLTGVYSVSLLFVGVITWILKYIAQHLFQKYGHVNPDGTHFIPYLGIGERPPDAQCPLFGFPSGHSILVMYFVTYLIVHQQTKFLSWWVLFALAVMYSRTEVFRCHYPNQVIYGGIIGTLLGYSIPMVEQLVLFALIGISVKVLT